MIETREADQRDPQTYAIIGACMAVHSELGHGFLEPVYQESLEIELRHRNIPYERKKKLFVTYRGMQLESWYEADLICFGAVILELKALSGLDPAHEAQVINYLKATGLERGLLINFGTARLQYKRLVLSQEYLRTSAKSADKTSSADDAE